MYFLPVNSSATYPFCSKAKRTFTIQADDELGICLTMVLTPKEYFHPVPCLPCSYLGRYEGPVWRLGGRQGEWHQR